MIGKVGSGGGVGGWGRKVGGTRRSACRPAIRHCGRRVAKRRRAKGSGRRGGGNAPAVLRDGIRSPPHALRRVGVVGAEDVVGPLRLRAGREGARVVECRRERARVQRLVDGLVQKKESGEETGEVQRRRNSRRRDWASSRKDATSWR